MTSAVYKPGDQVDRSGVYRAIHNPRHTAEHEVTVMYGQRFPPCSGCAHPRFVPVYLADHIAKSGHFNMP